MKGQSILLTHAILVGFSIFLIYAVTTTFVTIREDYKEFVGSNEIREMCFAMRSAAGKIYTQSTQNISTTTILGSLNVRAPDRISDMNYRMKFVNDSIVIESIDRGFRDTCKVGLGAAYNGTSSGGLTRLSYIADSNGTKTIEMVKA